MRIPGPCWECPPGLHVRLHGNLTARVTADHSGRTLVLQGIRSARTLRTLSRAVASFGAFGRYDRVLLDPTHFRDGSPEMAAALTADARRSAASGRSLGFAPVANLTGTQVGGDAREIRAENGLRRALVSMERPAPVPQVIDLRGSSTLERMEPQPEGAGRHEQCDATRSDPSGFGRAQGFHLGGGAAPGAGTWSHRRGFRGRRAIGSRPIGAMPGGWPGCIAPASWSPSGFPAPPRRRCAICAGPGPMWSTTAGGRGSGGQAAAPPRPDL